MFTPKIGEDFHPIVRGCFNLQPDKLNSPGHCTPALWRWSGGMSDEKKEIDRRDKQNGAVGVRKGKLYVENDSW